MIFTCARQGAIHTYREPVSIALLQGCSVDVDVTHCHCSSPAFYSWRQYAISKSSKRGMNQTMKKPPCQGHLNISVQGLQA